MKDEVEQVLQYGRAPNGYVVRELEGEQGAEVEYPDSQEVTIGFAADPKTAHLSPNSKLNKCDELLQLEGYTTEMVPGPMHHSLRVRRR